MRKLFFLPFLLISFIISAQVVTTSPAIPTAGDLITVYFHADQGTGGLADYTGDVYAHIGVITSESKDGSDWKYVKAEWDENREDCKLIKESANLYSLVLTPDIYTYFGCPSTETIQQVAMVFRGATGSPEGKDTGGKDIYVDIYEAGLNMSFERTVEYVLDEPGASVGFKANASVDAKMEIFIDGALKKTEASAMSITYTETFASAGDYQVIAKATLGTQVVSDTIDVCILATPATATRPASVQDGINYDSNTSVTFVLHAPNKENVLMLGDFNDWIPSNDYLLKKDGDYWWITIDGLTAGKEYAFQYLVDMEIAIADPYSEKVLDPWNDKWISSSTYPDLMAYPDGKADGIVGVIHPGAGEYQWDVTDFEAPTNDKLVIYELHIRDFVASQDVKDVTKELDYLDELGVTAIELMPVNEFEGNNSWGYNPSFYFANDKNYGTSEDLKIFIDSCHARGIAVVIDMVLNHSFYQSPLVGLYFDDENDRPAADNPWYNTTSPNTDYSWGADFNHDSPHTQKFVDRVLEYWLTEYKVDGFRFDFTKGFTNTSGSGWSYDASRIAHLKRIYDNMQSVNPDTYNYMILEHFTDNNEEKELANYGMMIWGNNNHAYMQCAMGYNTDASIANISHKNKGWTYPNLVAYQESHDEERMMYKSVKYGNANTDKSYNIKDTLTALDRQELAAAFFLTVPGPKMIWQFGELGYHYSIDYNDRTGEKPVRWDFFAEPDRRDVYDVYSKINKLRAKYPVFSSMDFYITESGTGIEGFSKRINIYHESANVAVIGNFDVVPQWVQPNFASTGTWYEFFSGEEINVSSTDMGIELQPGEYKLYSTVKMTVEQGEVELPVEEVEEMNFVVFPNPSSDEIYVEADQTISTVSLFTLSGNRIVHKNVHSSNTQVSVSHLPVGTYLLRIENENVPVFKTVIVK